MFMVLIFAGLKGALAKNSLPGLDFTVFTAVGFLAYFLWRNVVSRSMSAFGANSALFAYKQVKPIDTIIARVLLELLVSIMATLVFVGIGLYFGFDLRVKNFNMVILAVVWLVLFGFGIGLLGAVLGHFYENAKKIMEVIMAPLLFISAIMYPVKSLPPVLQELILYNPLAHFMELIHGEYFYTLDTTYVDFEYMLYWTLIPLFVGLYLYRHGEKGIIGT